MPAPTATHNRKRQGKIPMAMREEIKTALFDKTMTWDEIMSTYGVSRGAISNIRKEGVGQKREGKRPHPKRDVQMEAADFPHPIPLKDLAPEPARALEDIEYFARRYYGIQLLPWQVLASHKIVSLLATPYEEYAVINVAPGTGKSVFFGRILPAWLTARDRSMRGMIGSATNRVATSLVDLLRRDFTRPSVDKLTTRDAKQGLVQAESVLSLDFGRFRPDIEGHLWTRAEFEVAQHGDTSLTQKERTWAALGRDTTFIGIRVDFALWDDLWDPRKVRSSDAREDFFEWFDSVAESRLEPGGLFLLQGQRLDPNDVYRYALDKRDGGADLDDFERIEGDDLEEPRRGKYHHIVFKAYDASKDSGDPSLLRADAPAWPEGPLLSPSRLKWRRLRQIRDNSPDQFSLVYQQEDHDLAQTLVNPLWIAGGNSDDGEYHIGCRDDDRKMFEPPKDLLPPVVSVAMTDPSGVNMWANLWMLWQPGITDVSEDIRHIMAMRAKRMSAPEFLQYNSHDRTYSGLMEDWYQISKEVGYPIQHWIVEQNGAQRYLLQYKFVHEWMQLRGVRIHGHTTGRLKSDPELGVQALSPVFQRGLIRLPMADALANDASKDPHMHELIKQVTQYPHGTKDDIPMALWFFEANKDKLRPRRKPKTDQARPTFMSAFERKKVA
jgi:hypothetical protein